VTGTLLYTYLNLFNSVTLFNVKSVAQSKKYCINSKRNYFSHVVHPRNKIGRHSNIPTHSAIAYSFICSICSVSITDCNCKICDQCPMTENKIPARCKISFVALRAPYTVKQFAQHRLLRRLFDRVWGGLTVCATV